MKSVKKMLLIPHDTYVRMMDKSSERKSEDVPPVWDQVEEVKHVPHMSKNKHRGPQDGEGSSIPPGFPSGHKTISLYKEPVKPEVVHSTVRPVKRKTSWSQLWKTSS
jgi:hypothetical protein